MPTVHTSELDTLKVFLEEHGLAFTHPAVRARYDPLDLVYETRIDATLDPFSPEYVAQQIALYREISGRELDQASGELHPEDGMRLVAAPNPTGIHDAYTVAEYVRCVSTMLSLTALGGTPRVLDLGAGHGLGSEVLAYAGCAVHAIDIDPGLGALARARAAKLGLDITRTDMNFDDLGALADGPYDAAFFFQALHHSLKPWELIAALKTKLKPGGVIGFAGEPIYDGWPDSWGVRCDIESLYVARACGWFECGWSRSFIKRCFERNGMTLSLFTGGYMGSEIAIASDPSRRKEVIARAASLGMALADAPKPDPNAITDDRFDSACGHPVILLGRPAFRQDDDRDGALIHGPYVTLEPGTYEANFFVQHRRTLSAAGRRTLTLEVACDGGDQRLFRCEIAGTWTGSPRIVTQRFAITATTPGAEIRFFAPTPDWTVSIPTIHKVT